LVQVPEFTQEKCAGLLLEEEVRNLSQVRDQAEAPAVAVIGGAKIETKLPVIENLARNYQKVLVGGLVANEALDGIKTGNLTLPENVILPEDFAPIGKEEQRLDIGAKTLERFKQELAQARTIVWNGPLGKFEDDLASEGTREVIAAIKVNQNAFKVIGGGETLEAVKKLSDFKGFDYVSMSGGAMLDLLAGKQLPGLEALE
jgi:phosphoglycerate kinase